MNKTEFQRLVTRLEAESQAAPRRYRLKLTLLASLGYAYIVCLTALAAAGLTLALWDLAQGDFLATLKIGVFSGLVALLLVPALWVRIPEPQGCVLKPHEAPLLFAMIEKIRAKAKAPQIHRVVVNDVFNASIVQTPRLGILGWYRNTLIVGLPLMQALSRKEFAAVLAHEYGHLSNRHGKFVTWIYRIRMVWMQVYDSFGEDSGILSLLLTRFLRWYIPWFNAYSFVLARQDESEADRVAAAIVGPRTLADALMAIAVRGRFLDERFWPELWAKANAHIHPPFLPHATMRCALHLGFGEAEGERCLSEELQRQTAFDDTHPCLRERILALGTPCELPPEAKHSAAQSLLGEILPALQKAFDELWLSHNGARWRQRFHAVASAGEIVQRMQDRDLDLLQPDEISHFAQALLTQGKVAEALPLLCRAADHPHGPASAALAAARILHARDDEQAIHYLELATQRDHALGEEAALQAARFYEARGDCQKARRYWARLGQQQAA